MTTEDINTLRRCAEKAQKFIQKYERYIELKQIEAYKTFMYDPNNEYNCTNCPENRGMESDYQRRLPCSQQNCWVTAHTRG